MWCPNRFTCYDTKGSGDVREWCRHECGDTECLDFEQCFFGATSCGACIYLGGVWCPAKAKCTSSLAACNLSCGRDCVQQDAECAACERFDLPLRCSRLLPVIIVSALSSAVFLAALAWTLYEGHRERQQAKNVNDLLNNSFAATPHRLRRSISSDHSGNNGSFGRHSPHSFGEGAGKSPAEPASTAVFTSSGFLEVPPSTSAVNRTNSC